jgi:hypothetical protein
MADLGTIPQILLLPLRGWAERPLIDARQRCFVVGGHLDRSNVHISHHCCVDFIIFGMGASKADAGSLGDIVS